LCEALEAAASARQFNQIHGAIYRDEYIRVLRDRLGRRQRAHECDAQHRQLRAARTKDRTARSSGRRGSATEGVGPWDRLRCTWLDVAWRRYGTPCAAPEASLDIIAEPLEALQLRGLSDEDVHASVAYMRAVPPVVNKVPKSEYKVSLPPAYGPPITAMVPTPQRMDKVAYGAYLAGPLGHCIECHSTPAANGAPDYVNKLRAGGMTFQGPWGITVARNITPTNLKGWSDADIKKSITAGVRPNGERLMPPMAYGYYKNMTPEDLDALVAYLRTLAPK
jgi:mono/diheme cytochrome c family protein